MKIIALLHKQKNRVIQFIHLQLFITLVSIPILLSWGMPLSLLTFAGNLFFSPILTGFLLFSSLAFFCQMLGIPNGIFIICLEKITHWWLWLMQWGTQSSLVAIPVPTLPIIILIPAAAFAILHWKKSNTPYRGIIAYGILLMMALTYLKYDRTPSTCIDTLACNRGSITIIARNKQIILIDPGFIGQRLSAPSWCEYTLMPFLAKKYGQTTIDHLIILQPNRIIFDALTLLLGKITIKNLYLPVWSGTLPAHWWRSYFALRTACTHHECTMIRIAKKPIILNPAGGATLSIIPLPETIDVEAFSYPCIRVHGSIDSQNIEVYSAKYKKPIEKDHNGTP